MMTPGIAIALGMMFIVFIFVVVGGYAFGWQWTGLPEYPRSREVERRPVTLWAWLSILIVPTSVALGTLVFTYFQHLNDTEIEEKRAAEAMAVEEERAQAAALREYFDRMQSMLIEHQLRAKASMDTESEISKAHTVALLDVVGSEQKGVVIRFLHEAELINRSTPTENPTVPAEKDCKDDDQTPIIRLDYADLNNVDLAHRYLENSCLENTRMSDARLVDADLDGVSFEVSILRGADLSGADLSPAELPWGNYRSILTSTDLREATLKGAALNEAIMTGAHLEGADLSDSVMTDADLTGADLRSLDSSGKQIPTTLKGANVEGAILDGTLLQGVDLRRVKNLDQGQIDRAEGDSKTLIPRDLRRPESWAG